MTEGFYWIRRKADSEAREDCMQLGMNVASSCDAEDDPAGASAARTVVAVIRGSIAAVGPGMELDPQPRKPSPSKEDEIAVQRMEKEALEFALVVARKRISDTENYLSKLQGAVDLILPRLRKADEILAALEGEAQ